MMTGTSLRSRSLAALVAVTVLAGVAAPVAAGDEVSVQADELEQKAGAVDEVTAAAEEAPEEAESSATDEISEALSAVGDAVAATAAAVGGGIVDAAGAVAGAFSAIGSAIATAALAVGDALAWTGVQALAAASATVSAIGTGIVATVSAVGTAIAAGADLVATGTLAVASGLATAAVALATAIQDLSLAAASAWPSDPARQAAVAGAAGTTAAAGGAAWYTRAWRYAKYVPGLAPLYTRISRDEMLDHPKRVAIHEAIQDNPGIHLSELSRELDYSWGTLMHHLRKLEKADLVNSEEKSGKRCFFLPGQVDGAKRDILPALENETARAIAEFYAANPGASQSEAVDALGYSAALVSWHLERLEDAGVVERRREGRCQRVGVTQEARAVVAA